MLLPNTKESIQVIDDISKNVNTWLFEKYGGELGLVLESVDAGHNEQKDYGDLLQELDTKLSNAKKRKFLFSFDDSSFWVEDAKKDGAIKICKCCNVGIVNDDDKQCKPCKLHKNIGSRLPKTSHIIFAKKDMVINVKDVEPVSFDEFGTVYLVEKGVEVKDDWCKSEDILALEKINAPDDLQTGFRFVGNTAPVARSSFSIGKDTDDDDEKVDAGDVLSFEIIADASIGDKRIGILKMDVDHLGLIFSLGLEEKQNKKRKSISRIATLSRSMDMFFGGYLNKICDNIYEDWKNNKDNKWEYKDKVNQIFYIVYSGGDDLLIIGPWSEMPRLAKAIHDEFKAYTCQNPDIDISAGIFLCKPKYPISLAAKASGEQLEISKNKERKRITLFDDTVEWRGNCTNNKPGLEELLGFGEDLYRDINDSDKKLPRGFVHGLLRKYKQYNEGQDPNFIPAIIYQLVRNVKDDKLRNRLKSKLISDRNAYFKHIRIPASYALLKSRKEG